MGSSSITGDETILFADNMSFDGTQRGGKMTANGQLWIGSTAAPHVRKGSLTSSDGSVNISNSAGTIDLTVGTAAALTFTTDSGVSTTSSDNLNVLGGTGVDTSGAGDTLTISLDGAVVGQTITGDSGGALSPTAGNWSILGGPGVTTSGSGSTLTINSVVFTDTAAATLVVDNGYFATAAGTYVLPAAPAQGETVIIVCDTAGAVVVDAPGTQIIRIGVAATSAGGTATSTAIGDSLTLRYRTSNTTWHAVSSMGTWLTA